MTPLASNQESDRRQRLGAWLGLAALGLVIVGGSVGVTPTIGNLVLLPIIGLLVMAFLGLSRQRLRMIVSVIGAGIVTGLALGAALRLSMLVAALMGGGVERSVGGTVGLIAFFAVPGVVFSAVVMAVRQLRSVRPAYLAAITAVAAMIPFLFGDELAERGVLAVNIVTFAASFALAGFLVAHLQPAIERRWEQARAVRQIGTSESSTAK